MVDDDQGFRRARDLSPLRGRITAMAVLLLAVALGLVWTGSRSVELGDERLINVTGDVERPGWYSVESGVVRLALEASGATITNLPNELLNTELDEGWGVIIADRGISFSPPTEPLAFALPIDINSATKEALMAIPGIGESLSQSIVSNRDQLGLFNSLDDLTRVSGIGEKTVEAISPFMDVGVGLDESTGGDIGPH